MLDKPTFRSPDAFTVRPDYIPKSDYTDPRIAVLERERLWPRVWQIACREEEIPNVGDYVNYEICDDSIIVMRSAPGVIRAFHNVCPHRGRRLCDNAKGSVPFLFCNYHAWRYDLEGKLIDRPEPEDWAGCPGMADDEVKLAEVKVGTWGGAVWINMDPDCEPLLDYLAPLPEKLGAFDLQDMRYHAYWTIKMPVNWKVVLEAFVEAYHVPGTHPQMLQFGHGPSPAPQEDIDGTRRHSTHTVTKTQGPGPESPFFNADVRTLMAGQLRELHDTLAGAMIMDSGLVAADRIVSELPEGSDAATVRERYWEFQKEELIRSGAKWPERLQPSDLWSTAWQIFPNSSILPAVDGVQWYRTRPDPENPEHSIFDIWVIARYAPGREPKVEQEIFKKPSDFKDRQPFLEQDFANLEAVQKGMRSRGFAAARPSPAQEATVTNLHRYLHEYLFGD